MNRNEEFMEIKEELKQTPAALEFTVKKAITRAKKRKHLSYLWRAPVVSLCSVIVLFILLVNLFPKVALAMSDVPILKNLVAAVAFDPSLKLAVENDYYQPIGEHQTIGEVTATMEYMIVDAGHISLFFQIDAPVDKGLYQFELQDSNGIPLSAGIVFDSMYESGKLEEIGIEFVENNDIIPQEIIFKLTVNVDDQFTEYATVQMPATEAMANSEEDSISASSEEDSSSSSNPKVASDTKGEDYDFTFILQPEKSFSESVTSIPIKQWVEIKKQRIYLDCLNIYPTKTRLYLDCDDNNSAILNNLEIYFQDELGNIYDNRMNGITATGTSDSSDIGSIYFESSYFSAAKSLTMYITGISLVDKAKQYGDLDLSKKTISNLPEGISVDKMELNEGTLNFTLKVNSLTPNQLFTPASSYCDQDGNSYSFESWSTEPDGEDNQSFKINYHMKDYEKHIYRIQWSYSPMQTLDEPMIIPIK